MATNYKATKSVKGWDYTPSPTDSKEIRRLLDKWMSIMHAHNNKQAILLESHERQLINPKQPKELSDPLSENFLDSISE